MADPVPLRGSRCTSVSPHYLNSCSFLRLATSRSEQGSVCNFMTFCLSVFHGLVASHIRQDKISISYTLTPLSYTLTPLSYTLTPLSYTLTPLSYTLTPLSYTLTPLSYTLTPLLTPL
jgi:hypothetical protein